MGSDPAKGIDTPVNINIRALGFVRSARTGPPISKEPPPSPKAGTGPNVIRNSALK